MNGGGGGVITAYSVINQPMLNTCIKSIRANSYSNMESNYRIFASLFSMGQLLKESKCRPLVKELYIIQ